MAEKGQQISAIDGMLACRECDLLHRIEHVPVGGKALCSRCGTLLRNNKPDSLNRVLALNLAAFICFAVTNSFPFLSMDIDGRVEKTVFISGALSLYHLGMGEVGLLVFLTGVLFPLISITGMLYILLPMKLGLRPPGINGVYRTLRVLTPWCMLDVLLLGILIAVIKLLDIADIIPGISLYAFVALVLLSAAANASFDIGILWPVTESGAARPDKEIIATEQDWISCHTCAMLVSAPANNANACCPRCGSRLHRRKTNSVTRTWVLILTACLLLIPANIYPVMIVVRFGRVESNTILGGVVRLIETGMWPLAMIVFIASIIIPFLKLLILGFLQLSVHRKSAWRLHDRTVLYRFTELVGSWSMVDIFIIALLSSLVKMDALSTVRPGVGVIYFAGAVITTIFAANSFDPRLIWDNEGKRD